MNELEEAVKLFGREDLLSGYGIQDVDTNIEVFLSVKDMIKYYKQGKEIERLTNDLEREKSQVKEYGTRLIKAIEYIEKNKRNCENDEYCFNDMIDDVVPLLDILKGVDEE